MKGLRYGCCKEIGLVHEHVKSEQKSDIEYEKQRFSYTKLLESAKYFEKKNGFTVWTEATDKWLEEQEKKLGIKRVKQEKQIKKANKIKIALIVDVRNWALDNIAKNIQKYLSEIFDFKIIYMTEIPNFNIIYLFYACEDCQIIHFLWRGYINFIDGEFAKQYIGYYGRGINAFKTENINNKIIACSIYDHNYLNDEEIEITKKILEQVKYYTVSSKKLYDIYKNLNYKLPTEEITDGVDTTLFKPYNLERFKEIDRRKLVVGWVGNSSWYSKDESDHKGIHTIIKPAIEELINEGYNIKLELVDKQQKFIPHDNMSEYYKKIDIYICASINEGTPNPVLEAMACGVPVISTDVGIVKEVFGEKQQEYILKDRSKETLKDAIKNILCNTRILEELSKENLQRIQNWTWENKTKQFREFYTHIIEEELI